MPELKRILVPIDFSACSRDALRHALGLASAFGAEVHAMHVWEPSPYVSPDSLVLIKGEQRSFWEHMRRDLEERLETTVREVIAVEGTPDGSVETSVVAGYTSETILSTVRDGDYDLIVMGTHGRTGLSHVLLGSVAERIVRVAPCPVMTIKAAEEPSREREPDLPKGFDTPTMI